MPVIVTVKMKGDPAKLEGIASEDPNRIRSISERSRSHGVIAHRFYANDDGEIMVIDEWPDAGSFHAFFAESSDQIQPLMQEIGVQSEPEITTWHKLETRDDIGWGAD